MKKKLVKTQPFCCFRMFHEKYQEHVHVCHNNFNEKTQSCNLRHRQTHCDFAQGPLNIWIEHSNCQIHRRGDSKALTALLIPNIFLIFFLWNYFSMHIKAECMTQFDPIWYFSYLCRKFSELRALLKPAKIWNLSKNAHVWAA